MPEAFSPHPFEGKDPELSHRLVEVAKDRGEEHVLPEGYEDGDVIVGLPALKNPDFNNGVVQGPWKASETTLERHMSHGLDETDAHALADTQEKRRQIRVNTYPIAPVGVMKDVDTQLAAQEDELLNRESHEQ